MNNLRSLPCLHHRLPHLTFLFFPTWFLFGCPVPPSLPTFACYICFLTFLFCFLIFFFFIVPSRRITSYGVSAFDVVMFPETVAYVRSVHHADINKLSFVSCLQCHLTDYLLPLSLLCIFSVSSLSSRLPILQSSHSPHFGLFNGRRLFISPLRFLLTIQWRKRNISVCLCSGECNVGCNWMY